MLREQPPLADSAIATCLERVYGLAITALTFLPIGYDPNAAVYRIDTQDGAAYFLKLTRNPLMPASLALPRTLIDHGISNVLAPLRTLRHELWCILEPYHLVLYPFIDGENAMRRGMSDGQWRTFGTTLNAIHSSGLQAQFADTISHENFASPMIELVRVMQTQVQAGQFVLPVQRLFAAFWHQQATVIRHLTDRAEQLGRLLQTQNLPAVLCHGDIHAANIMLNQHDAVYLVDWDTPRIAPRERDLLFIIGSTIARRVTPREEALFFEGYGPTTTNRQTLTYYRYERVLEDLYEGGRSVFLNAHASVAVKEADAELVMSLFEPDEIIAITLAGDQQLG